jgi:hypothetical protein
MSKVSRRRTLAYVAAMAALGSLMTIVALGGGMLSVKRSASDLSQVQISIHKEH